MSNAEVLTVLGPTGAALWATIGPWANKWMAQLLHLEGSAGAIKGNMILSAAMGLAVTVAENIQEFEGPWYMGVAYGLATAIGAFYSSDKGAHVQIKAFGRDLKPVNPYTDGEWAPPAGWTDTELEEMTEPVIEAPQVTAVKPVPTLFPLTDEQIMANALNATAPPTVTPLPPASLR